MLREGEHLACPWALGRGRCHHQPHAVNHLADPREEERQAGRRQVRAAWGGGAVSHQASVGGCASWSSRKLHACEPQLGSWETRVRALGTCISALFGKVSVVKAFLHFDSVGLCECTELGGMD